MPIEGSVSYQDQTAPEPRAPPFTVKSIGVPIHVEVEEEETLVGSTLGVLTVTNNDAEAVLPHDPSALTWNVVVELIA